MRLMSEIGRGSPMGRNTQYRVIDQRFGFSSEFVVDRRNVQFKWKTAFIGQIVHIGLKEDIRPSSVKGPSSRLIAPYAQKVIVAPKECTSCAGDVDNPNQTICPNCIESWCWDWFVRFDAKWTSHGNYRAYNLFGCRCPECRIAGKKYVMNLMGQDTSNVQVIQGRGMSPTSSVASEKE
jgi:hypothetical protein